MDNSLDRLERNLVALIDHVDTASTAIRILEKLLQASPFRTPAVVQCGEDMFLEWNKCPKGNWRVLIHQILHTVDIVKPALEWDVNTRQVAYDKLEDFMDEISRTIEGVLNNE